MSNAALDLLKSARAGMTTDERRSFDNYVLGWLSTSTPADVWNDALAAAAQHVTDMREYKAGGA